MKKIVIKNNSISVTVLTLGAIIQSINAFGYELSAGYATEEEYRKDTCYFGGLIGRTANRTGGQHFIQGEEVNLPLNEKGKNHLHGGMEGFNLKYWKVEEQGDSYVTLSYLSPHGEEGYPGNLKVQVTYTVTEDSLLISYKATTDKPTWVNLTNHSYFNPFGINRGISTAGCLVSVYADRVSVYDDNQRVVGSVPVKDTVFDLNKTDLLYRYYDHNFYLNGSEYAEFNGVRLRKAAQVLGDVNIQCFTDLPCMQLYCGEFIPENTVLQDGSVIGPGCALALETQYEPNFQSRNENILMPNEEYISHTAYRFSKGQIKTNAIK